MGGRSVGGVRAGSSHTAAAATPAAGVDALFAQAGVIACRSAEDLAETALVLSEQPLPSGRRIGIVSNAGGMGVLAADALDAEGMTVPEFSAELQARINEHASGVSGTSNPWISAPARPVRALRPRSTRSWPPVRWPASPIASASQLR
jgi:acyl-CoA synthetase (NDP forming)